MPLPVTADVAELIRRRDAGSPDARGQLRRLLEELRDKIDARQPLGALFVYRELHQIEIGDVVWIERDGPWLRRGVVTHKTPTKVRVEVVRVNGRQAVRDVRPELVFFRG